MRSIMDKAPRWVLNYGILVIFAVLAIVLFLTLFIKFPNTLSAPVLIVSEQTTFKIYSRSEGKVIFVKKNFDVVEKDEVIAFFDKGINIDQILMFDSYLTGVLSQFSGLQNPVEFSMPNFRELGEFENGYFELKLMMSEFNQILNDSSYMKKIGFHNRSLQHFKNINENLLRQKKLHSEEEALYSSNLELKEKLYEFGASSILELNEYQRINSQISKSSLNIDFNIENNSLSLVEKERLIYNEVTDRVKVIENKLFEVLRYFVILRNGIDLWKTENLIISPGRGVLDFSDFKDQYQFVTRGKELLSVIPEVSSYRGEARLSMANSGLIAEGQKALIALDNYPSREFGFLEGSVALISEIPYENSYVVEIELPGYNLSNSGYEFSSLNNVTGSVEIVTEDLSLFNKLFYSLRSSK